MRLSQRAARRFMLKHQLLLLPRSRQGKQAVLQYIRRVGCIQYDPLDMAGNNPNLVLQARIQGFKTEMLWDWLYRDRLLVEGWDKNMSIYSVADWPYFTRYREAAQHRLQNRQEINEALPAIRAAVQKHGPLSSLDLEHDAKVDWPWQPTRVARAVLESMYSWGELVIHHRTGTRRCFDFANRHLPAGLLLTPDPNRDASSYFAWHVKRRIRGIGLLWNRSGAAWLGIQGLKSRERNQAFQQLEAAGEIVPVEVENNKYTFYLCREDMVLLEDLETENRAPHQAAFLAPLDNLLWDRKLIEALFDFEYVWEVYKPAKERQYGYYVLPVLFGDRFVARVEPRFTTATRTLQLLNWWWEPGVALTHELRSALSGCIKDFMAYLGAEEITAGSTAAEKVLDWVIG